MNIGIYIDGGSRGNPGPAAAGVVIRELESGKPVVEAGYFLGVATNNVAEYQGLVRALTLAAEMGADDVRIFSDSELMVKQITGDYRVKSPDLRPLCEQAQRLLLRLGSWQIRHVRREENKRADELVNLALDAKQDVTATHSTASDKSGGASDKSGGAGGGSSANSLKLTRGHGGAGAGDADVLAANTAPHADAEIPRWSAVIQGAAGACPMGCAVGRRFAFGPHTPKGFCVHAGQAMYMTDPFSLMETVETSCGHCGLLVRVEL